MDTAQNNDANFSWDNFKSNVLAPGSIGNWLLDPFDLSGNRAAQTAYLNQQTLDQQAREFNASEADKQRAWEQMMSSTAIQRQVADAEAAGINKYALLGGASGLGSSTPSGSSASSSSGSASMANNKLAAAAGAFAVFLRMFLTKGK